MREELKIVVITCNKCGIEISASTRGNTHVAKAYQGVSWTKNLCEVGVGTPTPDGVADFCKGCYLGMLGDYIKRVEKE